MAQKIITVFLVLICIGGLVYYFVNFGRADRQPSPSQTNQLLKSQLTSQARQKLVFVVEENNYKEIREVRLPAITNENSAKEIKKLFTDSDEQEKLIKISNLAELSGEVLAITSPEPKAYAGTLVAIDLKSAQKTILQRNFAVPESLSITNDGKKIAFTKFSNIEENYGYSLLASERGGSNVRELKRSSSPIRLPCWSEESSKVAFLETSGTKSEITVVDVQTAESAVVADFEGKIIDWLSWSADGLVYTLRDLNGVTAAQEGTIEIVSKNKNKQKLADFSGGQANFVYLKDGLLGYVIAQPHQGRDLTSGQIYIDNIGEGGIPIQKGIQVLGWLES